ncbi:hypothetical protein [Deinococcus aquaticus]|uniref:hypothetical protein n=1 Tax=Deinococcus aquaticus TaxID=328692 RepID=UPI003F4898A5
MPTPHPDELALKLTRALTTHDLDTLVATLQAGGHLTRPVPQARANLKPILEHAAQDHVNLLHPPADFHAWLRTPLLSNARGGVASNNTIIARTSTLRGLYTTLRREGLITVDPLTDFQTPPAEHARDALPHRDDLTRLLLNATDPHLHAALTLMYRHALQVTEILSLRWGMYDHPRARLLRRRTASTLGTESTRALEPLLAAQGGPLHVQDDAHVFPYRTQDDLRLAIFRVCQNANLPFIGPAQIRRASLRDFPLTQTEAGFADPRSFELAQQLARTLGVQDGTAPEDGTAGPESAAVS